MDGKNSLTDFGLVLLRIGIGGMFIFHGFPKMFGGPDAWRGLGVAMGNLGIHFWPTFWGFCAAFSELVGGACLILGFMFRPACALMAFTMTVAALSHLAGDGSMVARMMVASHAIEDGIVFISLLVIGPGVFSADSILRLGKK